jgi:hypothetical protein
MTGEQPTGPAPREVRSRTIIGARALINEGRSSFDCQIRNMSATGARLTFESTLGVPDVFKLEIPSRGQLLYVNVRWRKGTASGVKFEKT